MKKAYRFWWRTCVVATIVFSSAGVATAAPRVIVTAPNGGQYKTYDSIMVNLSLSGYATSSKAVNFVLYLINQGGSVHYKMFYAIGSSLFLSPSYQTGIAPIPPSIPTGNQYFISAEITDPATGEMIASARNETPFTISNTTGNDLDLMASAPPPYVPTKTQDNAIISQLQQQISILSQQLLTMRDQLSSSQQQALTEQISVLQQKLAQIGNPSSAALPPVNAAAPAPEITAIRPAAGPVGAFVTIIGKNISAGMIASFAATGAESSGVRHISISSTDGTSFSFRVPDTLTQISEAGNREIPVRQGIYQIIVSGESAKSVSRQFTVTANTVANPKTVPSPSANSLLPDASSTTNEENGVTAPFVFERDLFFGMRNDPDVSDLQEFLTDQGLYTNTVSGNFFILTRTAVKKFQQAHGITPSGYFGPKTRAAVNQILNTANKQ